MADGHHHVAGDVDQIAHLQVGDGAVAHSLAVFGSERQAVQRGADRLCAGIARQQYAEAAIDLRHESTAVAGVVVVAPAVALAEELERLLQQQARGQRQVVGGGVLRAWQQRRHQAQAAIGLAHRQLHHPRRVSLLPVHRFGGGPVGQHRQAHAHVQLQARYTRFFRCVGGARGGTGDDAVRTLRAVAEHRGLVTTGHGIGFDPGAVALAVHEQPAAIGTAVDHGYLVTGEQCRLLEAVDIGIADGAENTLAGREGTQRGTLHHQPVRWCNLRRNRV
ncbi:hypothetical protein D3C73_822630 [compost metagenome]